MVFRKMGFLGALAGYVGGKATVVTVSLGLFAAAGTTSLLSPVCPALAPLSAVLWTAAEATGSMAVSPIDPITTTIVASTTAVSGPL